MFDGPGSSKISSHGEVYRKRVTMKAGLAFIAMHHMLVRRSRLQRGLHLYRFSGCVYSLCRAQTYEPARPARHHF